MGSDIAGLWTGVDLLVYVLACRLLVDGEAAEALKGLVPMTMDV